MSEEKPMTLSDMVRGELSFAEQLIQNEGEITEEMEKDLIIRETNLPLKIDGYYHRMQRLKGEIQYFQSRAKEIQAIIKIFQNGEKWLKTNLATSMETLGVNELLGDQKRFAKKKCKSKLIIDEDSLPAKYLKEEVVYSADKDLIREKLEAGEKITGAKLEESYSITPYNNTKGKK